MLQERENQLGTGFAMPVTLIGQEGTKTLVKNNTVITPLNNHKALLYMKESYPIKEGSFISVSHLNGDYLELLKNNQFNNHIDVHPEYQLPIHSYCDNLAIFKVLRIMHIEGSTVYLADFVEGSCPNHGVDTYNAYALFEGPKSFYRSNFLEKKTKKALKNSPYHFNFKYKICREKAAGKTYKGLEEEYGVYHETIKDWYLLYRIFGKDGLTRKKAQELANTKFTKDRKQALALMVINGKKTFKDVVAEERVSLSRIRNWVKQERKKMMS